MEYNISNKAKKITLGLSIIGLILLVVGFFQQKDYVFADAIDEHTVSVRYNGIANEQEQEGLKIRMTDFMANNAYLIEIHSEGAHHSDETAHKEEAHSDDHSAHHGPTFVWNVHIKSATNTDVHEDSHASTNSENAANILVSAIESGDLSFFDTKHKRFWSNLLINGFFFLGISLGALFFLALHYATESGWGVVLLRVFEGVMTVMPIGIIALLIVFLAGTFGMHGIYPWMDADIVASDDIIWAKTAYLNKPFFWIRVAAYFGVFYLFMRWFKKKSRQEDNEGGTKTHFKMYRRGALFLVFFAVFSSTMSWDFIMSIDTHWYSTLFGWYVFSGMWLSGMVMIMMITLYLRSRGHLPHVKNSHVHDVAKWMFALSFLWSYLWFSQYMLIWYANIPEEATYFVSRIEDYRFIFYGTFFMNFFFPMVFLMARDTKRATGYLLVIGSIIFVGHWLDVFVMVMPGTLFDQWDFGFLEIGMFLTFLGLTVFGILKAIGKAPLLQKNHPYLEESKHHEF